MGTILAIANQKGGVGKTTTAISIAHGLVREGYKVLLVDNDPQCNATDTYGAIVDDQATVYDIMKKEATALEAIQHTMIGDIIACDPLLRKADNEFMDIDRAHLLKVALDPIRNQYDFVIIDTNPSLGVLLANALTCTDAVIVPIVAGRYSLKGINQLRDTIMATKQIANPGIYVMGFLMTMCQEHTNAAKDIVNTFPQLEEVLDTKAFKTSIRYTTKVKDSENSQQSIFAYAPYSTAGMDYTKLVNEILERVGERHG